MVSAQWFPTGRMGVYEGLMGRLDWLREAG